MCWSRSVCVERSRGGYIQTFDADVVTEAFLDPEPFGETNARFRVEPSINGLRASRPHSIYPPNSGQIGSVHCAGVLTFALPYVKMDGCESRLSAIGCPGTCSISF